MSAYIGNIQLWPLIEGVIKRRLGGKVLMSGIRNTLFFFNKFILPGSIENMIEKCISFFFKTTIQCSMHVVFLAKNYSLLFLA